MKCSLGSAVLAAVLSGRTVDDPVVHAAWATSAPSTVKERRSAAAFGTSFVVPTSLRHVTPRRLCRFSETAVRGAASEARILVRPLMPMRVTLVFGLVVLASTAL